MSAPKKTPTEWAKETTAPGTAEPNYVPCRHGWERDRYSWQHAAAAVRHGWADHKLATSGEILLSCEDYLAALKAVTGGATGSALHLPAVSIWCCHTDAVAEVAGIAKRNASYRVALSSALEAHGRAVEAWDKRFEAGETADNEQPPAFVPPAPPLPSPAREVTP